MDVGTLLGLVTSAREIKVNKSTISSTDTGKLLFSLLTIWKHEDAGHYHDYLLYAKDTRESQKSNTYE